MYFKQIILLLGYIWHLKSNQQWCHCILNHLKEMYRVNNKLHDMDLKLEHSKKLDTVKVCRIHYKSLFSHNIHNVARACGFEWSLLAPSPLASGVMNVLWKWSDSLTRGSSELVKGLIGLSNKSSSTVSYFDWWQCTGAPSPLSLSRSTFFT